jgi:hypothetical protein
MKEEPPMSADHDDLELSHWIDDYKAPEPRPAASPLDGHALTMTLKAQGRKLLIDGAAVVLSSAALTSFSVYLAMRTQKSFVLIGASMFLAVAAFSLVGWFHLHRGAFRASGSGTDAFLALARRRAKANLMWNRASRAGLGVFVIVVAAWMPFVLQGRAAAYAAEPWRAIVGFGSAFVIFAFAWRKLGKEVASAKSAYEALADTEGR